MWKIQKYRIKGGYSQERLAEAVDLSTSYVSEIETGKKRPSMKTLEKIAAVLGVPLVALLDEGPEVEQKKDVFVNCPFIAYMDSPAALAELSGITKEIFSTVAEAAEHLNAIIEYSFDGIFITDKNCNVLRINHSYEEITGLTKDEILGKNMADLVQQKLISESGSLIVSRTKRPVTLPSNTVTIRSLRRISSSRSALMSSTAHSWSRFSTMRS